VVGWGLGFRITQHTHTYSHMQPHAQTKEMLTYRVHIANTYRHLHTQRDTNIPLWHKLRCENNGRH
jgi:hypothetical protein